MKPKTIKPTQLIRTPGGIKIQHGTTVRKKVGSMSHLEPEHPGLAIKFKLDRFHEESKLPRPSVIAYAKELNVSASALGRLFKGKASLTALMALKLEKAFNMDAHALLGDQYSYDLVRAQNRMAAEEAMERYGCI